MQSVYSTAPADWAICHGMNQYDNDNNNKSEKVQQLERNIKLEKTKQKILGKKGRLKRYWDRTKQYRRNRIFQNNEKKILPPSRGRMGESITTTKCERDQKILEQNIGMDRS